MELTELTELTESTMSLILSPTMSSTMSNMFLRSCPPPCPPSSCLQSSYPTMFRGALKTKVIEESLDVLKLLSQEELSISTVLFSEDEDK